MQSDQSLKLKVELEAAWMNIANPHMSVTEAIAKLKELGNSILEVDYVGRRIKVAGNES